MTLVDNPSVGRHNQFMAQLAVFSSGKGSTFNHLIHQFNDKDDHIRVSLLITNKAECGAIEVAKKHHIKYIHFSDFASCGPKLISELKAHSIDFIVLAGFLAKVGDELIKHFDKKLINQNNAKYTSKIGQAPSRLTSRK